MNDLTLFHFDENRASFEDIGQGNGATHWREGDLMHALGYQTKHSFRKALTRAMQACLALNIGCEEHFLRQPDGDYLLTRFGCYLVAMNGDPKKPEVAQAQAWFATIAQTFQSHLEHADGIDRVLIREEVTEGNKSLVSTAKSHGLRNYAFFQNKGYMGMYNMALSALETFKGIKTGERILDRMGKQELAANLFRITQTDAKIKNERLHGQYKLEDAAYSVGKKVRETMIQISGTEPEHLPLADHIKDMKKRLKATQKKLKGLAKPARHH